MQTAIIEEPRGKAHNLEISEVVDDDALDEILEDLNSPESSEAIKAIILEEFLGASEDLEVSDVTEDAIMNDLSRGRDYGNASEATEIPLRILLFETPPEVRKVSGKFACPFKDSPGCQRTLSQSGYAKYHAKVHSHHIRCHSKSCRSRFKTQDILELHPNRIHGLEDIAYLDSSFKGPLMQIDGKYKCRFRELLGCKKTFSQNGHVNRHALLHSKEAIPCNVRGSREKFIKRENWERHFWDSHHQVLD